MVFIVTFNNIAVSFIGGENAVFNNISVISWQSVLFVDKTRVPGENHKVKRDLLYIYICVINSCHYHWQTSENKNNLYI